MRTFLMAATVMLWAMWAQAAITITGPDRAEVGETVTLNVDANFELAENATLGDIFQAIRKVQVMHENEPLPVSVRLLFIGPKITLVLEAEAAIKEAGRNFFWAINWTNPEARDVGCFVVAVGPEVPPEPDPPIPGDKYQVAIFYERTDLPNMPPTQSVLLKSLTFRAALAQAGHVLIGIVDDDIQSHSSGTLLAPFATAVKGKDMPMIAIAAAGGGAVKAFPLPATQEAVLELLRKGGE